MFRVYISRRTALVLTILTIFCTVLILTSGRKEPADIYIEEPADIYIEEPAVGAPAEEVVVPVLPEEDIALIALVTMAEAEGECEEGKRLVIDTILNRMDSPYFPDTAREVVYQPRHFESMWNGRVDRCEVRADICELVREELQYRGNYDVVFFCAGQYSKYGMPMFQVGNHYFSAYS